MEPADAPATASAVQAILNADILIFGRAVFIPVSYLIYW